MCQPDFFQFDLVEEPQADDEREAELVEASARLHTRIISLIDEYGMNRQEIIDILEAEESWWAEDQFATEKGVEQ